MQFIYQWINTVKMQVIIWEIFFLLNECIQPRESFKNGHNWFVRVEELSLCFSSTTTAKDATELFPTFWMIKTFNNWMSYNFRLGMRILIYSKFSGTDGIKDEDLHGTEIWR